MSRRKSLYALLATVVLVISLLVVGCGMEGDPLDDIYTQDVHPGTANTSDIGSADLAYAESHVYNMYVWDGVGWVQVPAGAGGGDVVGTPPSTDLGIARYDGITGLLIQDSGVTIDNFDNLDTNGGDIDGFDINAGNDVNVTNNLDVTDDADIGGDLVVVGTITGGNYVGIDADMGEVSELGVATYDDVQDYINFFGDRTLLTGGDITDNGDGTLTVDSGTAWAKETDSDTAIGVFFNFSADNSVPLTDLVTNYIYVDYNDGTPQMVVATSILTYGFKQDYVLVGTSFRDGTTSHFHHVDTVGIGRMGRVDMHHREETAVHRSEGMVTSSVGTRNLGITAGVLY